MIPNWPWIRRIPGRWPSTTIPNCYLVINQITFVGSPSCTPLLLLFITYKSQFLLAGSWYFRWLYKTSFLSGESPFWLLKSCEKSSFLLVKYEFLAGFDPHFCWSFWDSWPLTCSGRPARQQRGLRASLWHFGLGTLEGQRGSLIADDFRWGLIWWEYTISHTVYIYIHVYTYYSGWWFQTFFMFHYI